MSAPIDLREAEEGLRSGRTPFVSATVVRAERPTSAKPGDRALVLPDGRIEGFVGGACAESTVRLHALRLLDTDRAESERALLLRITPDPADAAAAEPVEGQVTVGNPCLSGGTLEIFLEAMVPPLLVYVLGDAPVARALVTVGAALGYEMRVAADPMTVPADTAAVVVASHGRDEEALLEAAVRAGVPYIGLIASRRRGAAVLAGLGLSASDSARVRTPAGLDIGARSAPEIALSVLAEIVATRPRVTMAAGSQPAADAAPAEALDPVCGMTVAVVLDALTLEHGGRQWYFCGPGCRDAFAADPDRYLAGG
ncbi:MAG TPA: XdhC family protein [Actinomycetes bacterium]|nr:XdhC family protein [Actinomycetes bacterium]